MSRRWSTAVGASLLSVAVLTGCVRADAQTRVFSDDTYSQHVIFAVDEAALTQALEQFAGELPAAPSDGAGLDPAAAGEPLERLRERYPDQVSIEDFSDGDLEGIEFRADRLPLDEFAVDLGALGLGTDGTDGAGVGPQAAIERVGDTFVVTIVGGGAPGGEELPITPDVLSLAGGGVDVQFTVVFPGLVTESNAGEVEGKTVTLGLADLLAGNDIRIVASANNEIYWQPIIQWGLVSLAFIIIVGGTALLVMQDRRKRTTTHLPPPVTT